MNKVGESVLTFDVLVRERCPTFLVMWVDTRTAPELDFHLPWWWLVMKTLWKCSMMLAHLFGTEHGRILQMPCRSILASEPRLHFGFHEWYEGFWLMCYLFYMHYNYVKKSIVYNVNLNKY